MFKKIAKGLKIYLTDWKNLLTHSLVGILLLVIAIFAPVNIYFKILFLLCVIGFNIIRMKYFK
ncbi:MAG: hypothetical protein Q4Q23_02910 [Methanobacteriaceae archaeon]|nr:hypothetical protein [Methanobacteriaceae archaeon]